MVGGKVIGFRKTGSEYLLNVRDTNGDECAVRCGDVNLDTGEPVSIGLDDQVWWQCGKVYWTSKAVAARPTCGHKDHYDCGEPRGDIPLRKIGYSH